MLEEFPLRQGRFRNSSKLTGFGDFSTLSISNERNRRKSWLINFNDHHRWASRSHNERQSEFISDVIFINGRETNFWKFAGDVTYKTQKSKTNLHSIHANTRTSRRRAEFRELQQPRRSQNHVRCTTCDVTTF